MNGETPRDGGRRPGGEPRDAAFWARRVERLEVPDAPGGAVNLNVSARREVGALQGFGQLWQKTYRVELAGAAVSPAEVVELWKERFPELQPPQSRFYPSVAGVKPGEVLIINATVGGMPVYTGVRVIYADEESFTVMTPEGHPESGWNTFSAHEDEDGTTVAQVRSLARANDPIYELGFRLVGSTEQERIWTHVLKSLAAHFDADGPVTLEKVLVDPKVQWSQAKNVRRNAALRSALHAATLPFRRPPAQDATDSHNRRGEEMREVELSAGTVEYEDTGGDGPALVLLHGLLMDASLWDGVVAELQSEHRCIVPTLPLGGHRRPMCADADLSVTGIARLTSEFLDRLDLRDVTLVGTDTGGAIVQLLMGEDAERVGRVVLASCDAFGNFPPGLTGKALVLTGKLPPPLFGLFMHQMRLKPVRRLPFVFGWLTKRGDAVTVGWIKPILHQPGVRRDAVRTLRSISADPDLLLRTAERLPAFDRPALVVWARQDRVMPPEHGRRLAEFLPQGRLVEVEDSYTLIPLDRPATLARLIREFARRVNIP